MLTWLTSLGNHPVAKGPVGSGVLLSRVRGVQSYRSGSKRDTVGSNSHGALLIVLLIFRWSCHCLLS